MVFFFGGFVFGKPGVGRSALNDRRSSWLLVATKRNQPECAAAGTLVQDFLVNDVVADRVAVEDAEDVLDGGNAHTVDRLAGDAGDMRGGDEVRQGQERV